MLLEKEVSEKYIKINKKKVWKVLIKKNKRPFALKEMSKVKIIDRKSERSIMYERELLSKLKHP